MRAAKGGDRQGSTSCCGRRTSTRRICRCLEKFASATTASRFRCSRAVCPFRAGWPRHPRQRARLHTVTVLPDAAHSAISPDPASRVGVLWITSAGRSSAPRRSAARVLCGPFHQPLAVFSGAGPTEDEKARRRGPSAGGRDGGPERPVLAVEPLNRLSAISQHHGRCQGLRAARRSSNSGLCTTPSTPTSRRRIRSAASPKPPT